MSLSRGRALCALLTATALTLSPLTVSATPAQPGLLTDPFLQLPAEGQVNVVWFTESAGENHVVLTGDVADLTEDQLADAIAGDLAGVDAFTADSFQLSRIAEDHESFLDDAPTEAEGIVKREIHRHEATVTGIPATEALPYRVVSLIDGRAHLSDTFRAKDAFGPDEPVTMLLTSDHQEKMNAPANLEYAAETLGDIDAALVAGDLINVPDRASEWFDHSNGLAFFGGMQGNSAYTGQNGQVYRGGEIAQNAVIYPVIGNHEVQGRIDEQTNLLHSFNHPVPLEVAEAEYEKVAAEVNPTGDPEVREQWIEDNSWSVTSYEEIFSLPESEPGGEQYYATSIGNTRLISLFSTRIWRGTDAIEDPAERETISRYHESSDVLDSPLERGYGDFIFEDLAVDSAQYNWLQDELTSPETTGAEHVIVMLHESPHSLGNNVMPHFADPVETKEYDDEGNLIGIYYEYPEEDNILLNSLMPIVDKPGTPVDLVFNGHSHLWNRFQSDNGVNFIETSNVGNSYGARHELSADGPRPVPAEDSERWDAEDYLKFDSPGGLEPIVPTVNPQAAANDPSQPAPYVASNQYSVFTGFDSETGVVSSWMFDGAAENPKIILLDEFNLADDTKEVVEGESSLTSSGSSLSGVFRFFSDLGGAIADFFARLF